MLFRSQRVTEAIPTIQHDATIQAINNVQNTVNALQGSQLTEADLTAALNNALDPVKSQIVNTQALMKSIVGEQYTLPQLGDAVTALKMALGKSDEKYSKDYDLNGDGKVDLSDVTGLLKVATGKEVTGFPPAGTKWSQPTGLDRKSTRLNSSHT
mgnify:CR=1 FL=1